MNEDNRKYSSVRLTRLPSDIEFPDTLRSKIYFDATGLKLVYIGRMTRRERDLLTSLSNKKQYKSAIKDLFFKSNNVGNGFEYWMRYKFVGENEQTIQAMVYLGAAFLVIIVGLRGLGDLTGMTLIPSVLLTTGGRLHPNVILIGLLFEFSMLCLLALVTYYSTSEKEDSLTDAIDDLVRVLKSLDNPIPRDITQSIVDSVNKTARLSEGLILEEKKILNNYNNKVEILVSEGHRALESLSRKYNQIIESENRILSNLSDNHVKPQVYMQKKLEIENQILSRLESIEQSHKRLLTQRFLEAPEQRGLFKRLFSRSY